MTEEWQINPFYPNYLVSNLGQVKNLKTGNLLRAFPASRGHLVVYISSPFHSKNRSLALIVYTTFAQEMVKENYQIAYRDGNKYNCAFDNLYEQPISEKIRLMWEEGKFAHRKMGNRFMPGKLNINYQNAARKHQRI